MNDQPDPTPAPSPAQSAAADAKEAFQAAAAPPSAPGELAPPDQRSMGMLCHLLALCGFVIPFGNIIGPLVLWLVKKEESAFVNDQGKEAVNFQITVTLAFIVSLLLIFVIIGIFLLPLIGIANLVFIIIATIKANEGVHYRYPFALRLIK